MAVDNVGQPNTVSPGPSDPGAVFDAAVTGAWQSEWTQREQARDQASASGNHALAQHFQNELDVLRLMMPGAVPEAVPPKVADLPQVPLPLLQHSATVAGAPTKQDPLSKDYVVPNTPALPASEHVAPEGNSLTFVNESEKPLVIEFTANAGEADIPSMTLQPGETMVQTFPERWSGNFRSTAGDGAHVTLGEVAFNGGVNGDQTFYDVSYIEGNNARMTITPSEGGPVSGTLDDIVSAAPESIKARDQDGNLYGIKKTTTSEVFDDAVVEYYRSAVEAGEGYVVPKDDVSTLGTDSDSLTVRIA
ncbi:hypothetical protein EA797_09920 [Stutzerimonas zhaodongensis]|uniref:Thaumatin pathogenesis-related protein n=1 Tax=Stutzerimonas zhaodongensis TaxID=1176257 RepID=A0A3M2HR86_9GAMM|nr:thaumatin family protein [Stutzerimonas zhaodongensis]MCQ4317369.1 hypothetical protein [Stutzerimonas zhaodongensis]RMH89849.1 hypothetical protein EA797_09920 [Stutzerimonas zhaodongensis]